jgi:deoxyribose-phosphate aldolase
MKQFTAAELAAFIDHTLLKPEATAQDIDRLCAEALEHRFHSVCVHGSRVGRAYARLEDSGIQIAAVVGFPLGAAEGDVKRYETEVAVDHGAEEIDVVINIGRIKDQDYKAVFRELRDVVEAADERPVKVILETCLLTRDEIVQACGVAVDAGARFVKTSTGFGSGGATPEIVKLMRETVGPKFGVKASGGIRDLASALAMIEAGANRLGTSAGVAIVQGAVPAAAGGY